MSSIIEFSKKDIDNAVKYDFSDIEDTIQYVVSSKVDCLYFVTNNLKDYGGFDDIVKTNSIKIRVIKRD